MTTPISPKTVSWLQALPANWCVDRLKDLIPRIVGGGTPSSADPENWDEGEIVWITPTDFSKQANRMEITNSARKITLAGLKSSAATLVPKGAVVMASRATIGSVRIAGTALTTNQGFISFVCDGSKIHNRFLYYVIAGHIGEYFAEIAPGTTFNEISRGEAKQEAIGFPPFAEQVSIADYLDTACAAIDAAIEAKRQQIGTLGGVRRDVIQRAVTRGFEENPTMKGTGNPWMPEVPASWELVSLKRVSEIQNGLTLGKTYDGELIERPYLRVANVQDGHLNLEDVTSIEVPKDVARRVELRFGDVLMTEGGDLDKLGRGTVWSEEIPECLHQNHIFAIRCFRHKLLPEFLAYLTASRYGRDYFEATGKRTTNLASTNSTKVGLFPIPRPTVAEQRAICQLLEQKLRLIAEIVASIEAQIDTLTAYRNSLVHECITGKRQVTELETNRTREYA